MSQIDRLIAKLCPDGVPYRKLSDVSEIKRGSTITKKDSMNGDVPVIAGGRQPAYYVDVPNRVHETVVVAGSGAYAGFVSFWNIPIFVSDAFSIIAKTDVLKTKYIYYFLKNKQEEIHDLKSAGGIPHVYGKDVGSFSIPCPPIVIQQEIVKILDTFSDLEASLEAELTTRKKQFEYFRDKVVTDLRGNCDWVPFGNIASIVRGASPRPIEKYFSEDDDSVPWIKIGDTDTGERYITKTAQRITREGANKSRKISPGDFILSNSMSFGRPYISKIHGYIHDGWLAISDFESHLTSDFLYFVLQSKHIQNEFSQKSNSGSVSNLNAEIVKSVLIPIPSTEKQLGIVDVLSKMEDLTISKSIGLPAEINARRKQYEYYRDKLLTFKVLEPA